MSELSRSEKMLAEKTVCIVLVRGEDLKGAPIYAYVGVRADKLPEFMEAQQRSNFDPQTYGIVIASGEGEPDEETRSRMERDYGFRHDVMLDLPGDSST